MMLAAVYSPSHFSDIKICAYSNSVHNINSMNWIFLFVIYLSFRQIPFSLAMQEYCIKWVVYVLFRYTQTKVFCRYLFSSCGARMFPFIHRPFNRASAKIFKFTNTRTSSYLSTKHLCECCQNTKMFDFDFRMKIEYLVISLSPQSTKDVSYLYNIAIYAANYNTFVCLKKKN